MSQEDITYDIKLGFYKPGDKREDEEIECIYPNPKPDEETIEIGLLDQRQPNSWIPITIVIGNKEGKLTYEILKTGLELTLGQYPYFAGRLIENRYVRYHDAWFSSSNSSNTDFKVDGKFNVAPFEFHFKKAIDAIMESDSKPAPLFAAKATFIKGNCVVLTTLTRHVISDGQTICDFIRLWAKHTSTEEAIPLKPIIKPDPVLIQQMPLVFYKIPNQSLTMLSFKISLGKLEIIQQEINKFTTNFVSKEDVFLAMYWRIFARAREIKEPSFLNRTMSVRSHQEYHLGLGNNYIDIRTPHLSVDDLMSKSIEEITIFIRSALPSKNTSLSLKLFDPPEFDKVKPDEIFPTTSHRMFYEPPISFHNQPSLVKVHLAFPYGLVIQPTDNEYMHATLVLNHCLVPKILADHEVASYGIDITVNQIN